LNPMQSMELHRSYSVACPLLHVAACTHLGYTLYYEFRHVALPELAFELRLVVPLAGKFKYLTVLVGLLQLGYYLIALVYDMCPLRELRQLRDFVLVSLVVPLVVTVSATFWTLYNINQQYVYPDFLDRVYPGWQKLTMYVFVVVYVLLELCLAPHRYPHKGRGFLGLSVVWGSYLLLLLVVHHRTGLWIYSFLDGLSVITLWFLFVTILGTSFVYYLLGESLNRKLW
ncbi:hypothetical protein KR222_008849, partial [Zaprionus bogoriensis]